MGERGGPSRDIPFCGSKEFWKQAWETLDAQYQVNTQLGGNMQLEVDGSSGDKTLEYDVARVMLEAFTIFKERQRKYGPGNIAAFGEVGCVVRATDKLARLRQFYINGVGGDVADEAAEDTWLDLMNYAAIGLLCHHGKWPGWDTTKGNLVASRSTTSPDPIPLHGSTTCSGLGATTP